MKVLIRFNHGLGDAVQLGIVLKHLWALRPDWIVDVEIGVGKESAVRHLCHAIVRNPNTDDYGRVDELGWWESAEQNADLPSTKPIQCLRHVYKIEPVASWCTYDPPLIDEATSAAVDRWWQREVGDNPAMLFHYQGNTDTARKNLTDKQAGRVVEWAVSRGLVPVLLDWDGRSQYGRAPYAGVVKCPTPGAGDPWGSTGTGDAAAIAAMVLRAKLFVGVDSGPLHVAGACQTPTIGVWTDHHPCRYFDVALNVVHIAKRSVLAREPALTSFGDCCYYARRAIHGYNEDPMEDFAGIADSLYRDRGQVPMEKHIETLGFSVRREHVNSDLHIIRCVYADDEYKTRLRGEWFVENPDFNVVDVGANIGAFSRLVLDKINSQAAVVAVEANPDNIETLEKNLTGRGKGRAPVVVHGAATYETGDLALMSTVFPGSINTGGSMLVPTEVAAQSVDPRYRFDDRPLPRYTLEQLMQLGEFEYVDILKLDCEGSEFSILDNSPLVEDRVKFIVGEYHGRDRWLELLRRKFTHWDYGDMTGGELGIFHLRNPKFDASAAATCAANRRLRVFVPAGIGDALWALTKMQALKSSTRAAHLEVVTPETRAVEFIRGFDFVDSVAVEQFSVLACNEPTQDGWIYRRSGRRGNDLSWFLIPNEALERGQRLHEWLPELRTNYDVMRQYRVRLDALYEILPELSRGHGHAVLYAGPASGNTLGGGGGFNTGELWKPEDWAELANLLARRGLGVYLVGGETDVGYAEKIHTPALVNMVGRCAIDMTMALLASASAVVSYPSGIGIAAAYLGAATAILWPPPGTNLVAGQSCCLDWLPPVVAPPRSRYVPLVYGCAPSRVLDELDAFQTPTGVPRHA